MCFLKTLKHKKAEIESAFKPFPEEKDVMTEEESQQSPEMEKMDCQMVYPSTAQVMESMLCYNSAMLFELQEVQLEIF